MIFTLSWTLNCHFVRNSLYVSHFGAKSKPCKARKISIQTKINCKVSTYISVTSQAGLDDFFRLSWTLSCHFIRNSLYFSHFGAESNACKARKNVCSKENHLDDLNLHQVSQVKPDLMIFLYSSGPWAAFLQEILYIHPVWGQINGCKAHIWQKNKGLSKSCWYQWLYVVWYPLIFKSYTYIESYQISFNPKFP